MPKANQKVRDLSKINNSFDRISKSVEDMADTLREFAPLVSDSLDLTKKLIKLYKEAFNAGLAKK